jgi:hypothetical protein
LPWKRSSRSLFFSPFPVHTSRSSFYPSFNLTYFSSPLLLPPTQQEKLYNPFYTLVLSRLLALHTHKFTLQYCLWDFLRDLGEGDVGGAEIVRAFKESGSGAKFGGKDRERVPERKVRNWARGIGWCIAKEGVSLSVLKVRFERRPCSHWL